MVQCWANVGTPHAALYRQSTAAAHLKSEQLLLFVFAFLPLQSATLCQTCLTKSAEKCYLPGSKETIMLCFWF